ncbi:MAG: phage tail tape measure protein, partial [Epsilonproteobacteria bacterium]
MATARAKFVFQAVDKTKAATASVRKNTKSVEKGFVSIRKASNKTSKAIKANFRAAEVAMGKLGSKAKAVGRDLSLKMTAPIAAMGVGILKVAAGFESAMNRVQAKTGATGSAFKELRDQAKALGSSTQFSARQAAEGQEILATAGFKTKAIMASLPAVLDLAAAGNMEMGESARFVAGTLAGFNKEASESGRVADILAKASLLADQNVGDMGTAMAKVATTASVAGLAIEDTAASLSVLAQKGRRGEEGGTALRNLLLELQDPAAKSRVAIERMGYSITNADGSLKSMSTILKTFNAAGFTAARASEIFGKRASDTYQILDQGQGSLAKWNQELIKNADGTAKALAAANLKGLGGELTKLKSALEGVAIAIADSGLLAWVTSFVARLGELAGNLAQTNPRLLKIATLVALAAASLGPLLLGLGALASSFSAIAGGGAAFAALSASLAALGAVAGPVILIVAGVAAVVIALVSAFRSGATWIEHVKDLFKTAAKDITTVLVPAFKIVAEIFNRLILPALKTVGQAIITTLAVTFRIVATVLKVTLGPVLEALADWLGVVIPRVVTVASAAWGKFTDFVRTAASKILEALGGLLGILAKLPGAVGEGFTNASEKIKEFSVAIGDLDTPIMDAVASVSSFAAGVNQADEDLSNPFEALLQRLRDLTAAGGEVAAVFDSSKFD